MSGWGESRRWGGIYRITLCRPDGSFSHYVGQASYIKKRLSSHRYGLDCGRHPNRHLQRAWDAYGPDAFEFMPLERMDDLSDIVAAEEFWIDALGGHWSRGGFNQRLAAHSNRGLKKSRESVERSAAGHRGRAMSEETKAKISAANRGRRPTDECLRLAVAARAGRPGHRAGVRLSPEVRKKISDTKRMNRLLNIASRHTD